MNLYAYFSAHDNPAIMIADANSCLMGALRTAMIVPREAYTHFAKTFSDNVALGLSGQRAALESIDKRVIRAISKSPYLSRRALSYLYPTFYDSLIALGEKWPVLIGAVLTDPVEASTFVQDDVGGPWPAAEGIISTSGEESYMYAKYVLGHKWTGPHKERAERSIQSDAPDVWLHGYARLPDGPMGGSHT